MARKVRVKMELITNIESTQFETFGSLWLEQLTNRFIVSSNFNTNAMKSILQMDL